MIANFLRRNKVFGMTPRTAKCVVFLPQKYLFAHALAL